MSSSLRSPQLSMESPKQWELTTESAGYAPPVSTTSDVKSGARL